MNSDHPHQGLREGKEGGEEGVGRKAGRGEIGVGRWNGPPHASPAPSTSSALPLLW